MPLIPEIEYAFNQTWPTPPVAAPSMEPTIIQSLRCHTNQLVHLLWFFLLVSIKRIF